MITQDIQSSLQQITVEMNSMEGHHNFLMSGKPSIERINNHRTTCSFSSLGSCNCNRGAYTFSEINDVEAQLLRTGNAGGTKSIQRVTPETSIGLENFSRVFCTPNAKVSLDAALSVGTALPGESRGTGNQFFGVNGKLSSTFAYWRSVLHAAFSLIPRLYALIQELYQQLTAEGVRADAAEARADLESARADSAEANWQGTAAGKEHLRQIQAVSRQHSADVAQLAQEGRRWAAQCEQLQQEKVSLHANHTARLREVSEAMEQERTNHLAAQEALKVRGVRGLNDLKALHAAKEASMAAQIQVLEDAYAASMLLLKVAQAAGKEEARRHVEAVQANARMIEEARARADAQQTAFLEQLMQNRKATAARLEEVVASMSEVAKRWTFGVHVQSRKRGGAVVRHSDPNNILKTKIMLLNRAIRDRVQAHRRRFRSDPYLDDACKVLGRMYSPGVPRPPATEPQERARYDARALLAAMKSTGKAAMLHALKHRIARAQQYRSVYDKVMRAVAEAKRIKRRSTLSKLKAAVMINGITGGYKAYLGFRRSERENGGCASACNSLKEVNEGTGLIWEACQADLTIYATSDGHAVSLRNTVEVELLRILQTARCKAPRKTANGKERAKPIPENEPRTAAANKEEAEAEGAEGVPPTDCLQDPDPYPDKWQDRFTVKFTWDSRSISKKMHQTEGMLLIIREKSSVRGKRIGVRVDVRG